MFGNNGMQFAPQDWQQMALTAGLSMLGNNDGSRSVGQLIGQGGLDALSSLHARKQYEQAMARQQMLDERAQAQHDMQMQKGQAELTELERVNKLKARYASGDRSPEVMSGLFAKEMLTHEHRMAEEAARAGRDKEAANVKFERDKELAKIRSRQDGGSSEYLPVDVAARKELANIAQLDSMTSTLESAVSKAFTADKNGVKKGGTGLMQGVIPHAIITRADPSGNELRSAVSNFSSQIMNWLSGAAVSEAERKRLESFLPTLYDDKKTLESKIKSYREFVRSRGSAWRDVYGDHATFGRMKSFGGGNEEEAVSASYDYDPATKKFVLR